MRRALEQSKRHYQKMSSDHPDSTIGADDAMMNLAEMIGRLEGRVKRFSGDVPPHVIKEMKADLRRFYRRSQSGSAYEDDGEFAYPTNDFQLYDFMVELCGWLIADLDREG